MKSSKGQIMTTSKGYIFDIKRFATHDGKGIRTTVFFKDAPFVVSGAKIRRIIVFTTSLVYGIQVYALS